jgi:formate hydrogenlyase subunit 3/multisubunit Na+/H+ antiporter MnhD subunit
VQSSIKSLVAYSSISQIGLIFIEVAAGWHNIALFHFAGNAFLRTYQLLVSPSVVSYLIQDQFYNFVPRKKTIEDYVAKRLQFTFFIVSLKEWNLDGLMYRLWAPLKWLGRRIPVDSFNKVVLIVVPAYVIALLLFILEGKISSGIYKWLPVVYSFVGFILVLKSFTVRDNVLLAWALIIINDLWIVLAVFFNAAFTIDQALVYLSGTVVSGIVGSVCLTRLIKFEGPIDLVLFQGHQYEHPKIAFIFLLACLGLMGFPITPTFIGEDLLFGHILQDQVLLAYFAGMSFIIGGISVIRIYSRVFLGPHIKSYHEKAYRSS